MFFYIAVIVGFTVLEALINFFFNGELFPFANYKALLFPFVTTIGLIAIDGLAAAIVRHLLPQKWFLRDVKFHSVSKKECKIYEALGIKNWKDKILELGMFTAFSKKKVEDPSSKEYIEQFIVECNYGVWCHISGAILAFLIIVCFPLKYVWCITFPEACVNFVLNILPVFILRYNVPRLKRMYALLEKKEKRNLNLS